MTALSQISALSARLSLAAPPEGAGVLAAGVAELAAALCESIARASLDDWTDARGLAVQAASLRIRAHAAGEDNAASYSQARAALHRPPQVGQTGRDAQLRADLIAAAETLLHIADLSADCVALASELAAGCSPDWRPDAAGAAELAAAAVHTAAGLVEVNLALLPEDERRERARLAAAAADADRERARGAAREV